MTVQVHLDDELAAFLREQCRVQRISFDQALNATLRRGMESSAPPAENRAGDDKEISAVRHRTFSSGYMPGINDDNLKQIAAEFELEDMVRKLRQ